MRPKSSATVVVVLSGSPARLSRPTLAELSGSSVSSGRTSLMALTSVVLPAPKPPAATILCGVRAGTPPSSECAVFLEEVLDDVVVGALAGAVALPHRLDPAGTDQVAEQHAD